MTFNNNFPNATDLLSNSQPIFKSNNQVLDSGTTQTGTGFSRNHVTMTDGTNGGLHNRIDFFQNISAPSISGFVSSLYPANISSASELQYTNAGGSTQITSGSLPIWKGGTPGASGVATITSAIQGKLNLPNGIEFRWGSATVSTAGTAVTFVSPFSTQVYSIVVTPNASTSRGVAYNSANANGFTAYSENNGTLCTYIAIGS